MRAARARWRAMAGAGLGALLLVGCAGGPEPGLEDQVPRPEWTVGDRWVFRRTTLAGVSDVVAHQVTAASADEYTVRVTGLAEEVVRTWTADLHLRRESVSGRREARYEPPAMYFAWPLALGKAWEQEFEYRDGERDGRYRGTWRVAPVLAAVDTLAGRFYAVRIEHGDGRGQRLATYWYSPRVRYWVRLENYASGYTEELVEFGRFPS